MSQAREQRWLGIRWIGTPWPKRIRLRSPIYIKPMSGCGCMRKPKVWLLKLRDWLNAAFPYSKGS